MIKAIPGRIQFFLAFDFCRFCVVTRLFIPATTANDLRLWRIFYTRFYPLYLFSYLYSWERASNFPFECPVLNKGTTGTIFITSLVWRGPWLGIEPGPSRTRSQHYTTRLPRRRYLTGDWTRDLPHSKPALIPLGYRGGSRKGVKQLIMLK